MIPKVLIGKAIPTPKSTAPIVYNNITHLENKFDRKETIPNKTKPISHGMPLNINWRNINLLEGENPTAWKRVVDSAAIKGQKKVS